MMDDDVVTWWWMIGWFAPAFLHAANLFLIQFSNQWMYNVRSWWYKWWYVWGSRVLALLFWLCLQFNYMMLICMCVNLWAWWIESLISCCFKLFYFLINLIHYKLNYGCMYIVRMLCMWIGVWNLETIWSRSHSHLHPSECIHLLQNLCNASFSFFQIISILLVLWMMCISYSMKHGWGWVMKRNQSDGGIMIKHWIRVEKQNFSLLFYNFFVLPFFFCIWY